MKFFVNEDYLMRSAEILKLTCKKKNIEKRQFIYGFVL